MAEKLTRAKFAIRSQQAEKDFLTAEYYERTGHPGSAVFYYELSAAGTPAPGTRTPRPSGRTRLVRLMQEGRPLEPGNDPFAMASGEVGRGVRAGRRVVPADEKDRRPAGVRPG